MSGSMRESNLRRFSSDEVALGKEEFFDFVIRFARCSRSEPANELHWESHKQGSTARELGKITLPLRTTPAGKRPRVNVDFHKAALRFFFSTAHSAAPMVPACLPDERCMAGPCIDANAAKRRNNISINRGRTERPDRRQAWQAQADWRSPTRAVADEMSRPKAAAIPASQERFVRR